MSVAIRIALALVTALCASAAVAADITVREYTSDDTLLALGRYSFKGGDTLDLSGRHWQRGVSRAERSAKT